MTHKRIAPDREITWRPPDAKCYACYDTGIISNGDGFLSVYLPDYDTNQKGFRHGGIDLAIICHCEAAYPQIDHDGKTVKAALRINDKPAITGTQAIGADIAKQAAREIHRRRKASWEATAADMTACRLATLNRQPVPLPDYIKDAKAKLDNLDTLFSI